MHIIQLFFAFNILMIFIFSCIWRLALRPVNWIRTPTNGVVQVLDEVMYPPPTSFWGLLDANFSIFKELVENVGLSTELIGEYTGDLFLTELFLK